MTVPVTGSAAVGGVRYPCSGAVALPETGTLYGPTDPWSEAAINSGFYVPALVTNSNGYNTYVTNQTWGMGAGGEATRTANGYGPQSITGYGPGYWWCESTQNSHGGAVLSYPSVQQLFNNYNSSTNKFNGEQNTLISAIQSLTGTYAENMHANPETIAEAAFDIWTTSASSDGYSGEIMIWVDTTPLRGYGGSTVIGEGTLASGQAFSLLSYHGSAAPILWFTANQQSGTVDILSAFHWLQQQGRLASDAAVSSINFGWEICSTGGVYEVFNISNYTLLTTL